MARIATGHYARLLAGGAEHQRAHQLLRTASMAEDRAIPLRPAPQSVLERLVFPLGEISRPHRLEADARAAHRLQPESQTSLKPTITAR